MLDDQKITPLLEDGDPEVAQAKLRHFYFGSTMGMEVLSYLLVRGGFGTILDVTNEAEIAEHNFVVGILRDMGVFTDGMDRMYDVVNALSAVAPVPMEIVDEDE